MCQGSDSEIQTLYKSEDFWIVNKPMQVHFDEVLPPSVTDWVPAHRLDFETSGCLLLVRAGQDALARQLFSTPGGVRKVYLAGASKPIDEDELREVQHGFICSRHRGSKKVKWVLDGDDASVKGWRSVQPVSHRVSLANESLRGPFKGHLYQVELLSGARHQIRAYFAYAGAPLVGDPVYGEPGDRLELHAMELSFQNPLKAGERISAVAPIR